MQVVSIRGDRALALLGDVKREVGLALLPNVQPGDYVIVHAGFAIQVLDQAEALETLAILGKMASLGDAARP
jgi:hydrogenase expression/formation protein HypC